MFVCLLFTFDFTHCYASFFSTDNQTGHNNVNLWTKNWIELYRDGYLKYYESDYSPNAEDIIYMPTECISIKTGSQVRVYFIMPLLINN